MYCDVSCLVFACVSRNMYCVCVCHMPPIVSACVSFGAYCLCFFLAGRAAARPSPPAALTAFHVTPCRGFGCGDCLAWIHQIQMSCVICLFGAGVWFACLPISCVIRLFADIACHSLLLSPLYLPSFCLARFTFFSCGV